MFDFDYGIIGGGPAGYTVGMLQYFQILPRPSYNIHTEPDCLYFIEQLTEYK